jgi:N6-adenosine-specific RNA methylase IME4
MNDWPFGLLRKRAYGVIYADPPWAYRGYVSDGVPQTTSTQHYDTMPVEDIALMPVNQLAAPDCALFMWTISSHTPQAFWLAQQWGFRFASKAFTWAKLTKNAEQNHRAAIEADIDLGVYGETNIADRSNWFMGMGHGTRRNTEDCWLFTRGNPKRLDRGVRELIVSPVREHSRKPVETYDRIEKLFAGPYCELFSRNVRPGWDMFGNQVGVYD